jgi:hypothetical protein
MSHYAMNHVYVPSLETVIHRLQLAYTDINIQQLTYTLSFSYLFRMPQVN